MTKELWIKRCAARFMARIADMNEQQFVETAETCFENFGGDFMEKPEDAADEELSCWTFSRASGYLRNDNVQAVTCGAGVLPNPCNGDIPVTFTPHELKTLAEKVLSSQAEQIRKLEAGIENRNREVAGHVRLLAFNLAEHNKELTQANETISALQARIEEADGQKAALWIAENGYDGFADEECDSLRGYTKPLFTRPPITSQREIELLDVIEQMRGAMLKTIDENGYLADGDNCTLIHLVKAVQESGSP